MLRFQSRQLIALLGIVALLGLSVAAAASGSCGEEEKASVSITPSSVTFNLNQTKSITVENTGNVTITNSSEDLPNPAPAKFEFVKAGCTKASFAPGATCTSEIKCVQKGKASYSFTGSPSVVATIELNCH